MRKINVTNPPEKKAVYEYWNAHIYDYGDIPPDVPVAVRLEKYTKKYFDDAEEHLYKMHPYLWNFAQFSRYSGKKILEIGIGAGTDFIQWVRSGCIATGCDLTPTAVAVTKRHLEFYNLQADVREEDCENLSFADESFDLVYCFGVIHHTPDPVKAVSEVYRVLKKGGIAKVMLYHRHSWATFSLWLTHGLKKGKPFRSIDNIVYHRLESKGTRVYSIKQAKQLFQQFSQVDIYNQATPYDVMAIEKIVGRRMANIIVDAFRSKLGWNLMINAVK